MNQSGRKLREGGGGEKNDREKIIAHWCVVTRCERKQILSDPPRGGRRERLKQAAQHGDNRSSAARPLWPLRVLNGTVPLGSVAVPHEVPKAIF